MAADYAVRLGPAPAPESYLNVPALLAAASKTKATLVHPGYGFLAENAGFARACAEAGLTFVGPPVAAIEAMGSKTESRERMKKAGVPVVPGMLRPAKDAREIAAFARESGYPMLLKASAGGGGKGMRRVEREADVAPAFERASSEAKLYFGDGAVYAEKLIERPRHVEVQVVGDSRGKVIAVGERECSVQRRHQKVVEECPSPVVDAALRTKLSEAAVAAARAVSYSSCGTVEFLLAPDRSFYFLDLAREMISIALGEPLSIDSPAPRGHAIECRVYAEDPRRGFAPAPGKISVLRLPQGPGVRHDIGVEAGSVVSIDYDPMLGKLIVHGRDRSEALTRLERALGEYEVTGVETTLPLFRRLLELPEFRSAEFDVQWLDRKLEAGLFEPDTHEHEGRGLEREELALAAIALARGSGAKRSASSGSASASAWKRQARRESLR